MAPEPRSPRQQREDLTTEIFWQAFQSIFILGVPAFAATFAGLWLDERFGTRRIITVCLVILAGVVSWATIIIRHNKLQRKLKELKKY